MTDPRQQLQYLLADMRRKRMHASAAGWTGSFMKGDPLTVQILDHWIPIVEQVVETMPTLIEPL